MCILSSRDNTLNQGFRKYKSEKKCTKHKRHKSYSKLYKCTKPQNRLVFCVSTKAPKMKWFCTNRRNTKHKTEIFSAKIGFLKTKINLLRFNNDLQTGFLTLEKSKLEIRVKNWFCVCVRTQNTTQK